MDNGVSTDPIANTNTRYPSMKRGAICGDVYLQLEFIPQKGVIIFSCAH
jgi:hypothetical protein